ncbi:MAG: hypothetical protein JNK72_09525 [Myxococcales bacterium]|nr:hypothetical protein [Myxococcales bacterium]
MSFFQQADGSSESAYESVAFTVEALAADPNDGELYKLAERLGVLLREWESIQADGRTLRRAVIRASAHAHVADARLDAAIDAFARDVLALVDGNTAHETYAKYFPEPHEEIIAMGLDAELPEVTLIVATLDAGDAPEKLKAHTESLRGGLKLGNAALADRADALADLGRHSAREQAWAETADRSLSSAHKALARIGAARNLPLSWADSFIDF